MPSFSIITHSPWLMQAASWKWDVISYNQLMQYGEPLRFGFKEGMVEEFLEKRVFSKVCNVTSEDYKNAYFQGSNKGRTVSSLLYFAHAVVG